MPTAWITGGNFDFDPSGIVMSAASGPLGGEMTDSEAGDAIGENRVNLAHAVKVKPL